MSETVDDKLISDDTVHTSLTDLFELFHKSKHLSSEEWHHENNKTTMETLGFQIGRLSSSLPEGGRGVFVTEGQVGKGTVVSMYPGTFISIFYKNEHTTQQVY